MAMEDFGLMAQLMHKEDQKTYLLPRVAAALFLVLLFETLFSVPYRTVHLATHSAPLAWIAGLLGLGFCVAVFCVRHLLANYAVSFLQSLPGWCKSPTTALLTGLLLRLLWILRFHSPLTSDGDGYFTIAASLAERHTFEGTYWPPGFGVFLWPFVAIFGAHLWVAILCGFLLFAALLALTYQLTLDVTGSRPAAALSSWIVAIWPGYIAAVGINCKETLIACLLVGAMLVLHRSGRSWLMMLGVGILVGCCALCQPGFTLFPAVIFLSEWLRNRRLIWSALRTGIATCAMVATILPCTYFNYLQTHQFILISSNGGSVFYTANNAHANASYSEESQQALPKDPVAADKEGYRLGKQWVREHPFAFAVLGIRKQVAFLGDDGIGVYEVMHRHQPLTSALLYGAAKGITSLYWFGLWIVLLCCCRTLLRAPESLTWFTIAFLPFAYQWAIDSVFESGSRHHLSYVGLLALLVAAASMVAINAGKGRGSYRMPTPM
jgi:4-amino-4-deoxy-L-arabinose transferase-like glycosyltransferase